MQLESLFFMAYNLLMWLMNLPFRLCQVLQYLSSAQGGVFECDMPNLWCFQSQKELSDIAGNVLVSSQLFLNQVRAWFKNS